MIEFSITGKLLDKKVKIDGEMRDVYGLEALHTNPRQRGLGKLMVKWIEEKAKEDGKYCVVGFARPGTFENFYEGCGWHNNGKLGGTVIMTSIPVGGIVANEHW